MQFVNYLEALVSVFEKFDILKKSNGEKNFIKVQSCFANVYLQFRNFVPKFSIFSYSISLSKFNLVELNDWSK